MIRLVLILCLIHWGLSAQDFAPFYKVASSTGIVLRHGPNPKAGVVKKLKAGTDLKFIASTDQLFAMELLSGQRLEGPWIEVCTREKDTGFVFSGLLFPIQDKYWPLRNTDCDEEHPCMVQEKLEGFEIIIPDYFWYRLEEPTDFLSFEEEIFNDLDGHIMILRSEESSDSFQVEIALEIRIEEQFQRSEGQNFPENWNETKQVWTGLSPWAELPNIGPVFYLDHGMDTSLYTWTKNQLNLRDTLVEMPSELYDVATTIYKGKVSYFEVDAARLRIHQYRSGQRIRTQTIRVYYSYGC